jgi:hypothetical protein
MKDSFYTYGPPELCAWQVTPGRRRKQSFCEICNANMVSTKKRPQAQPPSQRTMPLKEMATYPYTDENENLLYEVGRYEPKPSRQMHQKNGGLS